MTSSALVLLMVPGVGFFYSGLARRKSALALIWLSLMSIAVVGFQWFFWGYSLTFSHTGSKYIGDLTNFGLMKVLGQPSVGSSKLPDLLFCLYQGMFAAITYVALLFLFFWAPLSAIAPRHQSAGTLPVIGTDQSQSRPRHWSRR